MHALHSPHPGAVLGLCLLAVGLSSLKSATLYWDATGAAAGVGTSGTWKEGSATWSTTVDGTTLTRWANVNRDVADFRSLTGPTTITIADAVSAGALLFNSGGHTLSGATLILARTSANGPIPLIHYATGTGTNTISSNIVLQDAGTSGSAVNYIIINSGNGALTLGGELSFDNGNQGSAGNQTLVFQTGTASSSIVLNGNINPTATGASSTRLALLFGQGGTSRAQAEAINGTFHINGSTTCGRVAINGGTVIVGHDNALGSGTLFIGNSGSRGNITLLTEGVRTLSNPVTLSGAASSQVYIGGGTAHESTFLRNFNLTGFGILGTSSSPGTLSSPDPILTAAAGGKVNFEGSLSTTVAIPRGIIKQGAGIVSLNHEEGNNLKGMTVVGEGTLLLMNTRGSATGDASQLAFGSVAVKVEANARLGGSGATTGRVGASAATSVFTPGDMTKEGVSAIGTLNLTGGLVAPKGATFAFDISGSAIDRINLGAAVLDLDGSVIVNFTELGPVRTGSPYHLLTGSGNWSATTADFIFNCPAGYVLDPAYGEGRGYLFDPAGGTLTVQFAPMPEPSTYAFIGDTPPL